MSRAAPLFRIALRNVLRQRRRSALIAAAMTLGVATLAIFLALGDGMHDQWIDAGVRLADGHVTLETPGYRPGMDAALRLDSAALGRVRAALASPAVARDLRAAAPRLAVQLGDFRAPRPRPRRRPHGRAALLRAARPPGGGPRAAAG
jgi:putative ABC transport system permease protein